MNLKILRTDRGLSQKIVADAVGCSVPVYSRYETGARQPPLETLICLADFYGITLDELVGRTHMMAAERHDMPPFLGDDETAGTIRKDAALDETDLERVILKVVRQELEKRGL